MTHQQKLKALSNHLQKTAGVRLSKAFLKQCIDDYVFTDEGIFHKNEIPFSDAPNPEELINIIAEVEDKLTVDFEIDETEKLESMEEFTKRYPFYTIVKCRYFSHVKRWLIFGYEKNDDFYERFSCLTWYNHDFHNLANSTYGKCLLTYQIMEKDLEYIPKRRSLQMPNLSEYYGTYYTRKQLNLLEV